MAATLVVPDPGGWQFLFGSQALTTGAVTTTAVAAAGAFANTAVVSLVGTGTSGENGRRYVALWMWVDGVASTAAAQLGIRVWCSATPRLTAVAGSGTPIDPTDQMDVWCGAVVDDGSVTSAAEAGAMPSGVTPTATPNWGEQSGFVNTFKTPPMSGGAAERWRGYRVYNLGLARYFYVQYGQLTDTSHVLKLALAYSTGV